MLKIEFTQVFHATYQLEESQTLLEWIFEEESSVCSICSPISFPLLLQLLVLVRLKVWAKSSNETFMQDLNNS